MIKLVKYFLFLLVFLFPGTLNSTYGSEGNEEDESKFNLVKFAMHHISDSYSWTFFERQDGSPVQLQLPRILLNKIDRKFDFFISTERAVEHGYLEEHKFNHDAYHGVLIMPGAEEELVPIIEQIKNEDDEAVIKELKTKLNCTIDKFRPVDFSITKNVLFILFAAILLLWIFISIANRYKKNPNSPPKGIQSFFEPIIIFIRDDIAKENIPHHYERFMPILLNLFFFIWFLNLLGLMPFSANVTGNITVTASLALITFVTININGKKSYWRHIFWFPGIPVFIKPIMLIVEFIGLIVKPFALMIRLFANITAGHLVILSFISLIFVFGELGNLPGVGYATSVVSVIFGIFIDIIELFIALLQAYIFTILSALFIGQAVEESH